jgi:IclR family acetate operon transcriptional repressor
MVTVSPGATIRSVSRALSLLEAVAERRDAPSAQELATQLDLKLPTAHHLLATLVGAGFLEREARRYRLGSKVASLSAARDRDYKPSLAAERAMWWLAARTQETVYVSKWENYDVTIIAVADGDRAVRVTGIRPGLRGHAYARASGKVLLASSSEDRVESYLARVRLERLTPKTVVDPDQLRQELQQIRAMGLAIDREEFMEGVCCMAVAIPDRAEFPVWALTVTLPAWRFDAEQASVAKALREAAQLAIGNPVSESSP